MCVSTAPLCPIHHREQIRRYRGGVVFSMLPTSVKDTVEDAVWAVGPSIFDFTQAASYDRYGVMLAWGSRRPCVDNVGHGARRVASCSNSSAATCGDKGRQLSSKSHCCSLLRRGFCVRLLMEVGWMVCFLFPHSRILTPPWGDWEPWETPLGGAGPNSNRFTKLQDKM